MHSRNKIVIEIVPKIRPSDLRHNQTFHQATTFLKDNAQKNLIKVSFLKFRLIHLI